MLIAVIGIGGIARKAYLPVLGTRADLDLVLMSRSEGPVRQVQAEYRIPRAAANLDDVLRAGPQAAIVLTPDETHFEIIQRLLEGGVDVFVEKPATTRSTQTRELAKLADRHGRVLMVGYNRRFAPLHRRARELLSGKPPDFAVLRKDRTRPSYPSLAEQYTNDTIHQVDLLRFFCGEGRAVSTTVVMDGGKVIASSASVALESGGMAMVTTSFRAGAWRETYELSGAGQSISVEAFQRASLTTPASEQRWEEPYASWQTTLEGRGFTPQIDHFLACLTSRAQPETTAWDSVKTQLLLEDILEKL